MNDLAQKLSSHHIKPTAMRLVVLDFLLQQSSAQSLTDIELKMVASSADCR